MIANDGSARIRGAVVLVVIAFAPFVIADRSSWVTARVAAAQQQNAGAGAQQPTRTPRAVAPVDLTGVWAAAITEDWRWRMVTAPKGDYPGIPLNAEGQRVANAWDPAKDIAAGEQCRAYGAPGVMRLPTRVRLSWENETTLKLETDAGQQVRLFRFAAQDAPAPAAEATWQGVSNARWETAIEGEGQAPPAGGVAGGQLAAQGAGLSGSLKVVTTRMRPGYVRRNGVPYSAGAVLTEFFDRTAEPNGDSWLVLTSILDDPQYYAQPLMLTTHYKREPDASKWNARPCEVTMPVGPAASN